MLSVVFCKNIFLHTKKESKFCEKTTLIEIHK